MTWIEGMGDEVPIFFVLATTIVVIFLVLAWKSTDVPDASPPQTPAVARRLSSSSGTAPTPSRVEPQETDGPPDPASSNPDLILSHQEQQQQQEQLIPASNVGKGIQRELVDEAASTSQEGDSSDGVRKRKADPVPPQPDSNSVVIRLKYMDDSCRVVETSSSTTLGDFKRVNFQTELSANKVVKLIFNGQVLSEDSSTLGQLGLENNCVVHCLVHQPRSAPGASPSGSSSTSGATGGESPFGSSRSSQTTYSSQETEDSGGRHQQHHQGHHHHHQQGNNAAEAGIDIGGLLVPLLGVILALVWYCRIAYSAHFTAAATTALVGLSGICIVSVFLVWYPIAQDA